MCLRCDKPNREGPGAQLRAKSGVSQPPKDKTIACKVTSRNRSFPSCLSMNTQRLWSGSLIRFQLEIVTE
ncbi:hypothetical protein Mapa_002531 [Marchantia paleacea]|nr:hypothetical protein Mapa_002531 [Marchantia paleacea]